MDTYGRAIRECLTSGGEDQPDTIVAAVVKKFLERSELGKKKYGVTLDRTDLKPLDWIQHAQEELMDGILYLEKLKSELSKPT